VIQTAEPPPGMLSAQGYSTRFAQDLADVRAVQRLRFEVFNLELQEGLAEAYALGRDEDVFDEVCHHLLVMGPDEGVVGTYRMLSLELLPPDGPGLYAATEFDLSGLPAEVLADSVEVGRACVSAGHRSGRVITMLWRGLAHYMTWHRKRYLFGCCSIPATSKAEGHRLYRALRQRPGAFSETIQITPLPSLDCLTVPFEAEDCADVALPPLFESYLRLGARVCGPPALDAEFGTVDFFMLLDLHTLPPRAQRFFRPTPWER
jgi:putative hemolysin